MDYWRRAARTSRLLQGRNTFIREKNVGETNNYGKNGKHVDKYGRVVCMEDNRRPKRIMTWSPGGRRRCRRLEVKWEKEVEKVMMQRI
jgi:hypothetical protein